jgi:hypothetical protein
MVASVEKIFPLIGWRKVTPVEISIKASLPTSIA